MLTTTDRIARQVGLALAIGAIAAPAAFAGTPDSDDRNAAALAAQRLDDRSPDAKDYSQGRYPGDQPVPKVVTVPRFVEVSTSPTGIEWDDVAIGAGGAMGLVLVATGGALIVARRRRAPRIA